MNFQHKCRDILSSFKNSLSLFQNRKEQFKNVAAAGRTDIGLKRKNNEDRYLILDHAQDTHDTERFGIMFAVADGMGGHAAGETASRMACEGIPGYYDIKTNLDKEYSFEESRLKILETVIRHTHKEIFQFADDNREYRGMGTTISALVLLGGKALIAHVGDSRIYRIREGLIEQLTVDHTQMQELIDAGRLSPEEAATHHLRHILMQAVGVGDELKSVYTRIEKVKEGDIFLLCSDGLHDKVTDDEIKEIVSRNTDPRNTCESLIETALEKGGKDNITVVVVRT